MSTRLSRRLLGGLALLAATAGLPAVADAAGSSAATVPPPRCWKEYDFTRSGNVLAASAFKDCTTLDVPQGLPVAIQYWYSDPLFSGWVSATSGTGNVSLPASWCDPSWPTVFRHSITHEEIRCP